MDRALELGFKRTLGILHKLRGAFQDYTCSVCRDLDVHHWGSTADREFGVPSRRVLVAGLRTASLSCLACRAILLSLIHI